MSPKTTSTRVLVIVMLLLFAAAIAVPLLLKQIPVPLRLAVGFTDLFAVIGIAMILRQRKLFRPADGPNEECRRTEGKKD